MKAQEAAEIIKGIEEVRGALPEDGLLVEEALSMATKALELFGNSEQLPSAQPDLDEWCTDCKEYDQERHSCPRWNRVIRKTVDELRAEQAERREE